MSLSSALVPDGRLIIQTGFFVASLVSLNYFIVGPLLRLHNERRRRTTGAQDIAKSEEAKAIALQASFDQKWKVGLDAAREMRAAQVLDARVEADRTIAAATAQGQKIIDDAQVRVSEELRVERSKVSGMVAPLVEIALAKISALIWLGLLVFQSQQSMASEEVKHIEFWSGIFWPYFQFAFFAGALVYLARGPLSKMLDNQRIQFRSKLSEARQALTAAEQKSKDMELKLSQLNQEVEKLRLESTAASLREQEKMILESKNAADQLIQDANRLAQNLVNANRSSLTSELIDQVLAALEVKLTGDKLLELDKKFSVTTVQQIKHLQ